MIGGVPLSFAQEVSSVSGTCVSTQTVHRNLKCGLHGHISRRRTLRTTTQVLSRFFFIETYVSKRKEVWNKILLPDETEKKNSLRPDDIKRVR